MKPFKSTQIEELKNLGFKLVGTWTFNNKLDFIVNNESKSIKNIVYCFVSDNKIKYVGETTKTIIYRCNQYKNGNSIHTKQDFRIKNNIITEIKEKTKYTINNKFMQKIKNHNILIFIKQQYVMINVGNRPLEISLSKPLEEIFINHFKPEWNIKNLRRHENEF